MKLKLFEDFTRTEQEHSFLGSPYITIKNGKCFLPSIDFKCFDIDCLPGKISYLKYASYMRYHLFNYLVKYTGNNERIITLINILKNTKNEKYDYWCRILNQLGTNRNTLKNLKEKFNLDITDNHDEDLERLSKLDEIKDKVFNDVNICNMLKIGNKMTEIGDKAEINATKLLEIKWGNIYKFNKDDDESIDIGGVDLYMTKRNTKVRKTIQVKNIPIKMNISKYKNKNDNGYNFEIYDTGLGIDDYDNIPGTKLKYDYLILWDEPRKKMYFITSDSIIKIKTDNIVIISVSYNTNIKNPIITFDIPENLLKKKNF